MWQVVQLIMPRCVKEERNTVSVAQKHQLYTVDTCVYSKIEDWPFPWFMSLVDSTRGSRHGGYGQSDR
jgi:hypothetical protein